MDNRDDQNGNGRNTMGSPSIKKLKQITLKEKEGGNMEKENILFAEEKITEKEKEENIKGEKHIFCDFMILTFFFSLY